MTEQCSVIAGARPTRRWITSTGRLLTTVAAIVVGALVALAVSSGLGARAAAESSATGTVTDGSPEAIVVVGSSGVVASWWGGSGPRWTCAYIPIEAPFMDATGEGRSATGVDPVEGIAYVFNCDDETGHLVSSRFVIYTAADPFVVERIVTEARRRLELDAPVLGFNPPGAQLVGLPTWLWVDNAWFERTATATVGSISATVHARPVGVDWDTGDGGHELCARGEVYDMGRSARSQRSECTHVFQRSSMGRPGGLYPVRAMQRWVAWWTSSTGGAGSLGILSTTAVASIRVIEMQALVR
jgi:hypothetical protein